jgi:hypothetical protein
VEITIMPLTIKKKKKRKRKEATVASTLAMEIDSLAMGHHG